MASGASGPGDWPASLQDGVLTRAQALAVGYTPSVITTHVRRGRWQRLHPGVYATFSGTPPRAARLWAAVLRAGPGAVLSHLTAARLWDLPGAASTRIHVAVPSGSPVTRISGVVLHYSGRVDQARHPAMAPPRTTIEETALDLASAAATAQDAVSWVLRAAASRQTTPGLLTAALARRRRMRWRAEIAAALDLPGVHSALELRYAQVERAHGLPPGTRQRPSRHGGRTQYADVSYDDYATITELDGRAAHPDGSRWLDAQRDNANIADGQVTLRYSWLDVTEHGCEVAAQVALTLRRRGWLGSPRRCGPACRLAPALIVPALLPAARPARTPALPPASRAPTPRPPYVLPRLPGRSAPH
jgi:hypothetical protein